MKQAETKHLDKFMKRLIGLHPPAKWVKMHGSMYQSGVPDVWLMHDGKNTLIEFKRGRPRTVARLLFMCRPMQRRRLLDMAMNKAPGFIVASSPTGSSWTCVRVEDLLGDLEMELCYVSMDEVISIVTFRDA